MNLFNEAPRKDPNNRVIDGVCAGIANSLEIDPFWVRLGTVLLGFASGGSIIIVYIALAIIMRPEKPTASTAKKKTSSSKKSTAASAKSRAKAAKPATVTKKTPAKKTAAKKTTAKKAVKRAAKTTTAKTPKSVKTAKTRSSTAKKKTS